MLAVHSMRAPSAHTCGSRPWGKAQGMHGPCRKRLWITWSNNQRVRLQHAMETTAWPRLPCRKTYIKESAVRLLGESRHERGELLQWWKTRAQCSNHYQLDTVQSAALPVRRGSLGTRRETQGGKGGQSWPLLWGDGVSAQPRTRVFVLCVLLWQITSLESLTSTAILKASVTSKYTPWFPPITVHSKSRAGLDGLTGDRKVSISWTLWVQSSWWYQRHSLVLKGPHSQKARGGIRVGNSMQLRPPQKPPTIPNLNAFPWEPSILDLMAGQQRVPPTHLYHFTEP